MKQETLDTTSQSNIRGKNSNIEVLGIEYFYGLFVKQRTAKRNTPTIAQFKKIISTYLRIYFVELYMNKAPKYFFLSGKMKIVTYPSWVKMQRRGRSEELVPHRSDKAFGLFWYLRPCLRTHVMVRLIKIKGKRNAIPKIEAMFNRNNNKDLLPIFTEEQKKGRINKTLYKCIHT